MKGLLLKDLYSIRSQFTFIIVLALSANIISVAVDQPYICLMATFILSSNITMSLISIDEKSRFERISQTMPYKKSDHVKVKYLISMIFVIISIIVYTITSVIFSATNAQKLEEILQTLCYIISLCMLLPSISLPFIFKYGVEKGRFYYLIVVGLILSLATMSMIRFDDGNMGITKINSLCYFIAPICVVLFGCSYVISTYIYKKREF